MSAVNRLLALALISAPALAEETFSRAASPVVPSLALTSNADGTFSATATFNLIVNTVHTDKTSVNLWNWTFAPTAKFSGSSGATGLFSVGAPPGGAAAAFHSGATSISGGVLIAHTRLARLVEIDVSAHERFQIAKKAARAACNDLCEAEGADLGDADKTVLSERDKLFCAALEQAPEKFDFDPGQFCEAGKKEFDRITKPDAARIVAQRQRQYRFPTLDVSLWGGAGTADFNYYQQTGTTRDGAAIFAGTDSWHPTTGAALLATLLPPFVQSDTLGATIETLMTFRYGYEDSGDTATACMPRGTVAAPQHPDQSSGSVLSTCSPPQPLGAPAPAKSISVGLAIGMVDRDNGAWRAALEGDFSRTFDGASNTWSMKLPLYVNALKLASNRLNVATGDKSFAIDYSGIIRITPTFQFFPSVNGAPGWAAFVSFDLLTQNTLFVRADTLLK